MIISPPNGDEAITLIIILSSTHRNWARRDTSVRVSCKGDFVEHTNYRGHKIILLKHNMKYTNNRGHLWYSAHISSSKSLSSSPLECSGGVGTQASSSWSWAAEKWKGDIFFHILDFEDSYFRSALRVRWRRLPKSVNCKSTSSKPSKQRWHTSVSRCLMSFYIFCIDLSSKIHLKSSICISWH